MKIYDYIVDNYGYNEPVFLSDLKEELNINYNTLRQKLKREVDNGTICRYEYRDGVYFIKKPNSILKSQTISTDKVIAKMYLKNKMGIIGYETGLSFANRLRLTTQNPGVIEIVTMSEKAAKRVVCFNKRRVIVRKPRVEMINIDNYKLLQVLDLLTNFEKVSTQPLERSTDNIYNYLKDVMMDKKEIDYYIKKYPLKTQSAIREIGVYDEIT